MIELKNTSKVYAVKGSPPIPAVNDLTLCIARGQAVMVTGRSGSGKTTLLNLIAGLTRPTRGSVHLDGCNLGTLAEDALAATRNRRMGFVFQFPSLIPSLTALENVMLPALFQKSPQLELRDCAVQLLEKVGLSDRATAFPRQLSAGQQQRVVIARSLINRPEILLADEPTSNLDEQTEAEIMTILGQIQQAQNLTVIMVTHNHHLALPNSLRIEMAQGRLANGGFGGA